MSVNKILVTMQLDGKDVPCGVITQTLRGGHETIGFTYDSNYPSVSGAIPLSPDNPFGLGPWFSSGMRELRAISDAMPDRWGRNLMAREEARRARLANSTPRTLFDLDYLLGVDDVQRQGALRFWSDGVPQTSNNAGVPREVDLPNLLNASDAASQDMNIDVRDLLQAGSSLGGARPKASVRDERGILHIAKFPKNSESAYEDVCAWEKVSLDIASAAGLTVPCSRLLRIAGRGVLLSSRFDRAGDLRIPYISGLTAISGYDGAPDGPYTYLDLADFTLNNSPRPNKDLEALWTHALVSWAIGNTDNHMRNFGFLNYGGGWELSPTFDMNATSTFAGGHMATMVTDEMEGSSLEGLLDSRDYFNVSAMRATEIIAQCNEAIEKWQNLAMRCGINSISIDSMASRFECSIAALSHHMKTCGYGYTSRKSIPDCTVITPVNVNSDLENLVSQKCDEQRACQSRESVIERTTHDR